MDKDLDASLADMQVAIFISDVTGQYKAPGCYIVLRKGVPLDQLLTLFAGSKVVTEGHKVTSATLHLGFHEYTSPVIQALTKVEEPT